MDCPGPKLFWIEKMTQLAFDTLDFPSPCYVCDLGLLRKNLEVIGGVHEKTGCKILLALKGFAMFSTFPVINNYLQGICASSPHEARLGKEEFGGEVHVYAPAYSENDMAELLHLVHAVGHHQECIALGQKSFNPPNTFFLERFITYRQDFISDE